MSLKTVNCQCSLLIVTVNSPMFGVDCEMCLTSIKQLELTSISVVNEQGKLVYHTLVKPKNRIINYLTKYSGITEEKLRFVKKTLKDVQNDLRNILPTDAILMMHPYVIDSSLIYNLTHCRKRRSSLKLLTKMYLKRDIQENTSGHDPSEDAKASLELVLHKLKYVTTYVFYSESGYISVMNQLHKDASSVSIKN
ncbi:RNA exonuclease 5-like [Penaeus monodon]|uniref:RNA exonuclease 5-like n=1 Tax=Penaeus monodon TaxID=6687 RepID=UPI0018A7AAFA|nr:RNA exonuclease 5-like [Penaeus monodon]